MPHPARPTVTLHDVAAQAGVSVATASRVLSRSPRTVAPELERRVRAAAAALDYTVDVSARAMRRGSESITLVADDLTTPSIALMVAAMEREARTGGAFVSVASTRGAPERQLETIRRLRALRPRALVFTSGRVAADTAGGRLLDELRAYQNDGGRVVIVGDTDLPFDSISFDNHGSAQLVGRHLADTGHRRVAILGGPRGHPATGARVAGFTDSLHASGVERRAIRVIHCEASRPGGVAAATRLLAAGLDGIDAVVAANDTIAIGALTTLRDAGIRVPADAALTGFDDIPLAADVTPRLTTVALPLAEAGAEAIRFATHDRSSTAHLLLRGHLVVRESA
ncbi:MAG TPA: LacI family DNA-binding transcriptional regulator [Rugosimonospora sp.]|nr:LacI family DNA-binding transcriptional regulator [Rugosimonospora sp.]